MEANRAQRLRVMEQELREEYHRSRNNYQTDEEIEAQV